MTACVVGGAVLLARAVAPVITSDATIAQVLPQIAWVGALFVVRAVLATVSESIAHRSAVRVINQLREQVLTHSVELGPRWLATNGTDTATLVTRGIEALEPYFVRYLPQLLLTAVLTPSVLAVIAGMDLLSAVTIGLTIPLIPLFMWLVGVATQKYAADRLAALSRLGSRLLDLIAGLPTLQAFGRALGPVRRVRELADATRRTTMATLRVAFLSGAVLELLASLSVAMVAVGVGLRLVYGELDLVTGLAVLILAPEVLLPLRQVGVHFHAAADGVAAAERVHAVLDTPAGRSGVPTRSVRAVTALEWDGVSVRAGDRDYAAPAGLRGVVRSGTITALVGPNGSGKSTAAMTALGVQAPDVGRVLLHTTDGVVPLTEVAPDSWWTQLAWVPQRPVIEPGTLREYVTGGESVEMATTTTLSAAPSAAAATGPTSQTSDESAEMAATTALSAAAAATGFAEALAGLPLGWDTPVGRGGVGLSLGQRQRLALTRGLLHPGRFLVLDEPTAHLDAASEAQVLSTLRAAADAGKGVLVIAHRPELIAAADHVIEVYAGPLPDGAERSDHDADPEATAGPAAAEPSAEPAELPGVAR
ncbi:thiol reductant ABC exporter subunit CydD [Occultella glacieicola]|uniref:Thiol reductant ABC exporter subunit CydD n=2 Tax=Occultella glacieicola TaxID=2518684 RepID=A0ABY2DZD9_9MICO|nr:thiol reductant ABC exporter subunit CydD [Occultella glacieicola]